MPALLVQLTVSTLWHRLLHVVSDRMGILAVLAVSRLLQRNEFAELALAPRSWLQLVVGGLAVICLAWRLLVGRPSRRTAFQTQLDQLELGLLVLANVFALIQVAGGPSSWAQPIAYVAVAYLVGFSGRALGVVFTLCAVGFQLVVHHAAPQAEGWRTPVMHGAYLLLFGLANWLFLQVEVVRRRRAHERLLAHEMHKIQEEARDFRLISSALSEREGRGRAEEEAKLARGAVDTIHQGMFFVLNLLKRALELQTCVLLWLDASGRQLRIKEMVTDSTLVNETPIPAHAGALGGVVKNRLLLNLQRPSSARCIPYYAGGEHVGAFAGVPVLEDGHLRGVLCADRRVSRPFSEHEEKLLVDATRQILCAIQTERVLAAVERSKYEHERFYRASTMLNSALTLDQVYETAFAAAREITDFDFAALTVYDPERQRHTISRVFCAPRPGQSARRAEQLQRLEGEEFANNAGLVAMVVKNKHFLPAGEGPREADALIFTRKLRAATWPSLVVLPLVVQDQAIGAFVLAAELPGRFPKQTREMLGVICNQVAVALENAKMYRRMEEMATTDGLTELPNHRTFQARFSEMLQRAERHGKPVSLVLTDVDRFKSINDTYGHPVGDQVLKAVARALASQVRKVDIVARYGGEEFAIVLEETDTAGAHLLCERVRQQIAAHVMSSDKGTFRVTISLGIASYPHDGAEKQVLIERADQALYSAKQTGRDRTVCYGQLRRRAANA